MKTLIVGNGGRESALAKRMAESSSLHAFMRHANPSLIEEARRTNGKWEIGNILNPKEVARFARKYGIDIVMVSADDPLAAGVVDALLKEKIPTVGPTKKGAQIEWDKVYSRKLIGKVAPEANPFFRIARTKRQVERIFEEVGDLEVAVKPRGLTGGKGVKVMGPHLRDKEEAKKYALEILESGVGGGGAVIIEERIEGVEFTLQAITDGKTIIFPPATYDHPYRFENDTGPGTGGMGAYSMATPNLPFMSLEQYTRVCEITRKTIDELKAQGRHFNGVLNGGFFISQRGIRVIEFNARFGDPECMNIMTLLASDWVNVMVKIHEQRLTVDDLKFNGNASVTIYLVSPDYAIREGRAYTFELDKEAIENEGCRVFFSSAVATERKDMFTTVGTSRSVGLAVSDPDVFRARELIGACIERYFKGPLQWRKDIATREAVDKTVRHVQNLLSGKL